MKLPRPDDVARRGPNDPYLFRPVRRLPLRGPRAPETRPHAVVLRPRPLGATRPPSPRTPD